jgi:thiamine-phosphate pyrophosphorylase
MFDQDPGPPIRFRLYAVADAAVTAEPDFAERVAALGELGGERIAIYVRNDFPQPARIAIGALRGTKTKVFVRRDALATGEVSGAAGVHLTSTDLAETGIVRRARKTEEGLLVGASVHDVAETVRARDAGCAFVMFGHVFATPGKAEPGRGVHALAAAVTAATPLPVFAIGGITPAHVDACKEAGAFGVAAVRGLFGAPDPRPMLEAYLEALGTS